MGLNPNDLELDEEKLAEASVIKEDLSKIFQDFEKQKQGMLHSAITKNGLNSFDDDEQSVYSYIERHRANIAADNDLWKDLEKIESDQQKIVRTKMKQSGEQDLKLSGGGTVRIEAGGEISYSVVDRLKIVDVKPKIEDGPLCLSLPLQDENGRNMKEKDAKYLFINYDDDGKLTHVSHPEPIEFEGNKCCFNIEGKKYYLKMEKQKLEELKKEIEKNRGYEPFKDSKSVFLEHDYSSEHAEKMKDVFTDIKNRGEWKPKPPPRKNTTHDLSEDGSVVQNYSKKHEKSVDKEHNSKLDATKIRKTFEEKNTLPTNPRLLRHTSTSDLNEGVKEFVHIQDRLKGNSPFKEWSKKYHKENPPSDSQNLENFLRKKENTLLHQKNNPGRG